MEVSRLLREMPKPTIARLHGAVAGAGMSIALACDLRIAGQSTVLTTAFAKVALSGDFGGTYYLTQLLGPAKAKELYFGSELVRSEEALRLGLYTRLVEDEQLASETAALANRLAAGPGIALANIKRNINRAAEGIPHGLALDLEAAAHIQCAATADHLEAATAFVGKRSPVFVGR
jgi:2-(1,2-epoxy-1,2-dihydrophenyl)acetyl-CoA isomerase